MSHRVLRHSTVRGVRRLQDHQFNTETPKDRRCVLWFRRTRGWSLMPSVSSSQTGTTDVILFVFSLYTRSPTTPSTDMSAWGQDDRIFIFRGPFLGRNFWRTRARRRFCDVCNFSKEKKKERDYTHRLPSLLSPKFLNLIPFLGV